MVNRSMKFRVLLWPSWVNNCHSRWPFCIIVLLCLFCTAFGQNSRWMHWQQIIMQKEQSYLNAKRHAVQLSYQVDSLGVVIDGLKKQSGFFNERKLARVLAQSHTIANKLVIVREEIYEKMQSLQNSARAILDSLQIVNAQVAGKLLQAEAHKDTLEENRYIAELQAIRQLMQRCRRHLATALFPEGLSHVTIDSTETDESLQRKLDFILDQADRLKKQSGILSEKRRSLQTELHMRNRISDFVDDLALTEPRLEVARSNQEKSQTVGGIDTELNDSVVNTRGVLQPNQLDFSRSFLFLFDRDFFSNIENLSVQDIEKWIEILQKQEKRWGVQADSLVHKAKQLEKLMQTREENF